MLQNNNFFRPHHVQNVASREWDRIHIPRDSGAQGLPKRSRQSCRTGTARCITLLQNPHTGTHPAPLGTSSGSRNQHIQGARGATQNNAPAEQQLLLAASSVFHKRAGALHTHYPAAIRILHSKAQGQRVDVLQPHPSQIPGSSGTSSIRRGLKAPPGHSTFLSSPPSALLLIAPLITPIYTSSHSKIWLPKGM